ncbi:unnamed protein product [Bursaphelenchus okinawaensis]|uniref:Uncharacterized protein n=1 Tax=Bursaphelenchus okinawaensis TaxID=465554 RepID=A0A811K3R0_9BILA|nr:unnamed protein product [Bursaphelenchus okinawaensis]CAG9090719.1 unnamed protein product [Bursaphelenchus okinawaensis]
MAFNAELLRKVLDSNVLKARPSQVICAKFLSFKQNGKSVVRSTVSVCPHHSSGKTEDTFELYEDGVTILNYVFSLKNIDNLYVYGQKGNEFVVLKFEKTDGVVDEFENERKLWMVGDILLSQSNGHALKFYSEKRPRIFAKDVDLFNEKVIGSVENGDLWFPDSSCKTFESGEENKLVESTCSDPNQLLLSFAALKAQGATLSDDEANANNFAILFYEQAPTTTTTSTTSTTTTPLVTEVDFTLPEESTVFVSTIGAGNGTTDSSGSSNLVYVGIGCAVVGLLVVVIVAIVACIYFYRKKKKADPVDSSSLKTAVQAPFSEVHVGPDLNHRTLRLNV